MTGRRLALLAMVLGAVVMAYPYAYMAGSSMKTRKEFAEDRRSLVPARYQPGERLAHARGEPSALDWPGADWSVLRNYVDAIRYGGIDRFLGNSFLYALLITAVQLSFNVLAAYAFARMRFPGRSLLFGMLLATMMVPPAVLLIPNFLVVAELGLVDTMWGVVVPSFAGAFGIFLLRQAFLNIPADLEDAAPHRRLRLLGHPGERGPAALQAGPRHPRAVHLHGRLEHVRVATGGAEQRGLLSR